MFFLVLTCLSADSNALFGAHLQLGACKLSSPYIFVAHVLLTSLPYYFLPSTPEGTQVVPSLLPIVSRRNIRFHSLCACTHDPWTSSSPKSSLIHMSDSAFQFGNYSLIYLFIHSIFHEPFNYVIHGGIMYILRSLSLRIFGLLNSSLLLYSQRFGRYVLRPSGVSCRTR